MGNFIVFNVCIIFSGYLNTENSCIFRILKYRNFTCAVENCMITLKFLTDKPLGRQLLEWPSHSLQGTCNMGIVGGLGIDGRRSSE